MDRTPDAHETFQALQNLYDALVEDRRLYVTADNQPKKSADGTPSAKGVAILKAEEILGYAKLNTAKSERAKAQEAALDGWITVYPVGTVL